MFAKQSIPIHHIDWTILPENMVMEKNINYVFKVNVDTYYTLIENDYVNVISLDELKKASSFKYTKDKNRFISGRYFLRNILSKSYLINPFDIEFQYSEFKKPFFNNIQFNLSHSGKYVLSVISANEVGIDVEFIDRNVNNNELLDAVFSAEEISYIKNSIDETLSFYLLWTRKEAILKGTGEGLIDRLESVRCMNNIEERKQTSFHLTSFKIDNDHIACIAAGVNKRNIYITI